MSWGCVLYLRWPVGRRTVTSPSYTLSCLGECAQERARSAPPPSSPLSPRSSTSIKGEKHGRFLSLRCHIINSGVSGMIAVFMQVEVTKSRIWNWHEDGASNFTEAGPLPVNGGRVELLRNTGDTKHRDITNAALLRSYQDITFLAGHHEAKAELFIGDQ